jgi:hypothetical protein
MAVERSKLEKILRHINRLQADLDSIRTEISSVLGESVFAPPDHLVCPLKLWNKIKDVGETVTNDQLHVIATSLGYDTRGLGGFFSGPDASLVRLSNERIGLREWASNEVEKYKEWLDAQR